MAGGAEAGYVAHIYLIVHSTTWRMPTVICTHWLVSHILLGVAVVVVVIVGWCHTEPYTP